jgi:hypothetical protein
MLSWAFCLQTKKSLILTFLCLQSLSVSHLTGGPRPRSGGRGSARRAAGEWAGHVLYAGQKYTLASRRRGSASRHRYK